MNFTFFSSANAVPIEYSYCFIWILLFLLSICIAYSIIGWIKEHNIWIRSLAIMLGIWFSTGIFLHWYSPDNFISDWISSATVIGTVPSVLLALSQYKQQRQNEFIRDNRAEIIKLSLRSITKLDAKYNLCFKLIKRFIEEKVIPTNNVSSIKDKFTKEYDIWLKDIESLVKLTTKIRSSQASHINQFPELSLFGVSQKDLQELSNCIAETINCTNNIQKSLHKVSLKIKELKGSIPENYSDESNSVIDVFLSQQNDTCKAKAKELIDLLGNSISNPSFEPAFNKLMELGNKIIKS